MADRLGSESGSFWVILAVAVASVVLGVWRPRFSKSSRSDPEEPRAVGDLGDGD